MITRFKRMGAEEFNKWRGVFIDCIEHPKRESITDKEISGYDLSGLNFYNSNFTNCIFRNTNFFESKFDRVTFQDCTFEEGMEFNITESQETLFERCTFKGKTVDVNRFVKSKFVNCKFPNSELRISLCSRVITNESILEKASPIDSYTEKPLMQEEIKFLLGKSTHGTFDSKLDEVFPDTYFYFPKDTVFEDLDLEFYDLRRLRFSKGCTFERCTLGSNPVINDEMFDNCTFKECTFTDISSWGEQRHITFIKCDFEDFYGKNIYRSTLDNCLRISKNDVNSCCSIFYDRTFEKTTDCPEDLVLGDPEITLTTPAPSSVDYSVSITDRGKPMPINVANESYVEGPKKKDPSDYWTIRIKKLNLIKVIIGNILLLILIATTLYGTSTTKLENIRILTEKNGEYHLKYDFVRSYIFGYTRVYSDQESILSKYTGKYKDSVTTNVVSNVKFYDIDNIAIDWQLFVYLKLNHLRSEEVE